MIPKFKKIPDSLKVYTENGYAASALWLFNSDWLAAVACKSNRQLVSLVSRVRTETTLTKLRGEYKNFGATRPLEVIDLSQFVAVSLSDAREIEGFRKGNAADFGLVAYKIGSCAIDAEFFHALLWDSSAVVMAHADPKKLAPLLIVKAGEIVGMISPIRFK